MSALSRQVNTKSHLFLQKPITDFYLKYNLSSGILVYEKLCEENKFTEGELTKTKYGTSVDTTMSHGSIQTDRVSGRQVDCTWKETKNGTVIQMISMKVSTRQMRSTAR